MNTSVGDSPSKGGAGELSKNSITIFLSTYIDQNGTLTERGLEVFQAMNMDHLDLAETSVEKILQEDLDRQVGPAKADMKTMRKIAKTKFDRYEQKRLYKAQRIYQYEMHEKKLLHQGVYGKHGQRHSSPEIAMVKNFSKMPPLKVLRDPNKNQVRTASLLGISAAQLKKLHVQRATSQQQQQNPTRRTGSLDAINGQQDFNETMASTEQLQFLSTQKAGLRTQSQQKIEMPMVQSGQMAATSSILDSRTASWFRVQQNRFSRRDQAKSHFEEKIEKYEKKQKAIEKMVKKEARYASEQTKEKQEHRNEILQKKHQDKAKQAVAGYNAYSTMRTELYQKNFQHIIAKKPYQNLENLDEVSDYQADPDAGGKRVGNAMFITQPARKDYTKADSIGSSRNIPRKGTFIETKKHDMSKTSNEFMRYEKSKELHDVRLALHKDGDELMAKLNDKLQLGELRRLQLRDRSVKKLQDHNERVQRNVESIAEWKASTTDVFPADFIDKMAKIKVKQKEKAKNVKLYVKEIREKSQSAMATVKHRKQELDAEWATNLKRGIKNYETRYAERKQRRTLDSLESCRLKSALTSQRIIDTKQQWLRMKNDRLQRNAMMIKKHEGQHKSLNQRRDMLIQFNDMTRTFNFTKNTAQQEFKEDMLFAAKLSPKNRRKFIQTNSVYEKLGVGNAYNTEPLSPGHKEADTGGFFITQSNNVGQAPVNIAARSQTHLNKAGIPKVELYR